VPVPATDTASYGFTPSKTLWINWHILDSEPGTAKETPVRRDVSV
jgi:hypothetical protein